MKTLLSQDSILSAVKNLCRTAKKARAALALISLAGWRIVEEDLGRLLGRGGELQLLLGTDMWTDPDVIAALLALKDRYKTQVEVRRFDTGGRAIFHPKTWIFSRRGGSAVVLVGSSNTTTGGLGRNYEVNVRLNDAAVVAEFEQYFDELFGDVAATPIDRKWLGDYRKIWNEHRPLQKRLVALQRKARSIPAHMTSIPDRIYGNVFAFTGKIQNYPREAVLYPLVTKYGGQFVEIGKIQKANCLVRADTPSSRQKTRKLVEARNRNIAQINEGKFLSLLNKEKRLRQRKQHS